MTKQNPIFCAIDTTDMERAKRLIGAVSPYVGGIKLGLEFFSANGMKGVLEIEKLNVPIFLDLKFHDIPNTVSRAITALMGLENMFMLTVHAAGGKRMIEDAVKAATVPMKRSPHVVAVTVLTSLDKDDLGSIGVNGEIKEQVTRLASLAKKSGAAGVVCSSHEVSQLRTRFGQNFILVVPGIRPAKPKLSDIITTTPKIIPTSIKNDDQKRVMTPKEAMDAGASYLVIGRPITEAENPAKAAEEIFSSL